MQRVHDQRLRSDAHRSFESLLQHFLEETRPGPLAAACLGVAGPVVGDAVQATNLPWVIRAPALATLLGTSRVRLLNDMEATFAGIDQLGSEAFAVLQAGTAAAANQALIAAGTGLGQAFRVWLDGGYRVVATEGGHASFAPRNEQECALLHFVRTRKGLPWVSVEQLVSGRGFHVIHEFLDPSLSHPSFDHPEQDPAAEVTANALAARCPVCVAAVDLWITLYGAEAGNLALRTLARGGVFVAGGIAPKILPKLREGGFVRAFCEKGELGALLRQIPVWVVLDEEAPLKGAAAVAAALARSC